MQNVTYSGSAFNCAGNGWARRAPVLSCVWPMALILAAGQLGCGGGASGGGDDRARAMMRMVGIEYGRFLAAHNGQPPQDDAELRRFIDAQISQTPNYGVSSAQELLTSPRDGQPLKVVVGKKAAVADQPDLAWAAFEQTGVGGQRLAVNTRGLVQELSSAEVDRLVAP